MVLAFDRGRAKVFPLLICCRRAAAYGVAMGARLFHRRIPSEWNAADGPSRKWRRSPKPPRCRKDSSKRPSTRSSTPVGTRSGMIHALKEAVRLEVPPSSKVKMAQIRVKIKGKTSEERRQNRCAWIQENPAQPRFRGQTRLEEFAVSPQTSNNYQRRTRVFQGFCNIRALTTSTAGQADKENIIPEKLCKFGKVGLVLSF